MDDTSFMKTRHTLTDFSSTESIGSAAATRDGSPPPVGEMDVDSWRRRMTPPGDKLAYFAGRAQAMADTQQFDACIGDLVRCVALARLVHGERHLKLAQAHVRLAEAYLQFKGWGAQAQEHSSRARELLLSHPAPTTCNEDGLLTLTAVTLKEAESFYLNAAQILEELSEQGGIIQEEKSKTELKIATALSRLYQRQGRPEEALFQCEKSLQLLGDQGDPEETCSTYRDMAAIEQSRGCLDRAIEHLTKARSNQSPGGPDRAHISHSLAKVHSSAAEPHHNESAAHYFEESLDVYRNTVGSQDPTFLSAQDDYCHFLLINGQKERCVEIQKASLAPKRSVFGEWSAEVADSQQLIGGVEMTQGRITQAHRTMRKCLEIQQIIYGPQHKKTKDTQKTVDMLARAPEVVNRKLRQTAAVS
ncbi:Tetratricopeptide repeat protein 23 [Merluccius polli]|uniref:Tetratricopeptide repeat protein 23 n=1 Tax=Merluccius polli TaxID=89951 RepID=A0AA47M9Q1_MERPO|nr:Tetratricopeptide repeat protein 23 [Merluccius polli]